MKKFTKASSGIKPSWYTDYRSYIAKEYEFYKKNLKPYSYNRFTADLGLGNSNLMYHLVKGNRPLTIKTARKIANGLGLTGNERMYFIRLVDFQITDAPEKRQDAFQKLLVAKSRCTSSHWNRKSLDFFNHWYHSAIYELLRLDNCQDSSSWIARHLKPTLPESKIKKSLELLEECQMLSFDESKGKLVPTEARISTGQEVRGIVFKSFHSQMISLALAALSKESGVDRDISSVTLGFSPEALPELKKVIAEFRQKVLQLEERFQGRNQVMQVNIQAFPLTKVIKEEK